METPQVLLEHHLKALRLPTFLREYDKVAQQCAAEGVDYPRYLLRLSEQELLDREAAGDRAANPTGPLPRSEEPGQFRLPGDSVVEQGAGAGTGPRGVYRPQGERAGVGQLRHGQDAHRAGTGIGGLPEGLPGAVHHGGVLGARADGSQGREATAALPEAAGQLSATDYR